MCRKFRALLTVALLFGCIPKLAVAGPCDAYFPFDDTLADAGNNGYDGEMIGAMGESAKANYTEGKFGKALMLDGNSGLRALIDLHWDGCPQVTVSAWIKVSRDASSPSPVLFSTGQGSGPGMYFTTNYLRLNGTENGIYVPNVVRPGSWMFVAGIYNYETDVYELHYGGRRPAPGKLSEHRREPENAFWIGTENDDWGTFAGGVAVDDLRIVGRALDMNAMAALRAYSPTTTASANEESAGDTQLPGDQSEPTQGPGSEQIYPWERPPDLLADGLGDEQQVWEGLDCESHDDCFGTSYCGWDRVCHPDRHAPMQELELPIHTVDVIPLPIADTDTEPQSNVRPGPTGEPSLSSVSGYAGDIQKVLDYEVGFIPAISWGEKGDRPCRVEVGGWRPWNDESGYKAEKIQIGTGSDCLGPNYRFVELDAAPESAINRVQVCNNNNNNRRLKGLRIWGERIRDDGTTNNLPNGDSSELSNCSEWRAAGLCPIGKFATGLVVHSTEATGDREQITGLQLICRAIVAPGVVN